MNEPKVMNKNIPFKFSGLSGDMVHYLAGIKAVCELYNCKADIYIWLNQTMESYEGAIHPYGKIMINDYAFEMLKPLLEAQKYVSSVQPWRGEKDVVDIDTIRQLKVGMPFGSLAYWLGIRFPDMQCDLSKHWLELNLNVEYSHNPKFLAGETILINRTQRYHNPYVSYFFLKDYKNVMFTGLADEHAEFCKTWELDIHLLKVRNFYELADYIGSCRFFIGNQSMCFAIAEGLKVPRILEMCPAAPNVHPQGEHAHYFYYQEGLTYWTEKLNQDL